MLTVREQDSQTFWKARGALDKRLAGLLHSVGETWFGPFKGVFMGDTSDSTKYSLKYKELCAKLKKNVSTFFDSPLGSADNILDMVLEIDHLKSGASEISLSARRVTSFPGRQSQSLPIPLLILCRLQILLKQVVSHCSNAEMKSFLF
jgi:hypothetical protein